MPFFIPPHNEPAKIVLSPVAIEKVATIVELIQADYFTWHPVASFAKKVGMVDAIVEEKMHAHPISGLYKRAGLYPT